MRRSGKVATPATAVALTVPSSVAAGDPAPSERETVPVNEVATLPNASSACTLTRPITTPAGGGAGGGATKAGRAGVPERAVALNVTGDPLSPAALAVTVCAPTVAPSRHVV